MTETQRADRAGGPGAHHADLGDDAELTAAYQAARDLRPRSFRATFDRFHELDPHFAAVWCTYTGGLAARKSLDVRTRLLALTGMYTVLGDRVGVGDTVGAAVEAELDLKEVLEVIFQCWVYAGEQAVVDAVDVFVEVADGAGRLDEVKRRGLPRDATVIGRSLDAERTSWTADDAADPRLPGLLDRHGWTGISTGLRLRPHRHLSALERLERLDVDFAGLWVDAVYQGMYSRAVLDDPTRMVCMVADCVALGEIKNGREHMRGALRAGATPTTLRDVMFLACAVVGHPHVVGTAMPALIEILESEGMLPLPDQD